MKSCFMHLREHIPFDSIPPALLSSVLDSGNINTKRFFFAFIRLKNWYCTEANKHSIIAHAAEWANQSSWRAHREGCWTCAEGRKRRNSLGRGFRKMRWNS